MQQPVDVIIKVVDAETSNQPSVGLPTTGDVTAMLAVMLVVLFSAGCLMLLASRPLQRTTKGGGAHRGAHRITLGFIALMLGVSTVALPLAQAQAAPLLPAVLNITVTKGTTQSMQSVVALPLNFDNAAGYGTEVRVVATKNDLAQSTGTLTAPVALTDNSFGFALVGNPTPTPANLLPNGFAPAYPLLESATNLVSPFAGFVVMDSTTILQNEVEGTNTANLYLSAKVAPTLATGSYHVTLSIELASYVIDPTPPTPFTISVAGTITFDDNSDEDGIRPTSTVPLELYKTVGGVRTLTTEAAAFSATGDPDVWDYEFADLPALEGGLPVAYEVEAGMVTGYNATKTGDDFTFEHLPGTTYVAGTITWADWDNDDEIRPATVALELYKTVGGVRTLTTETAAFYATGDHNVWDYEFADLLAFEGALPIAYEVEVGNLPLGYLTGSAAAGDFAFNHDLGHGILMAEWTYPTSFFNTGIDRYFPVTSIIFQDSLPAVGTIGVDTWDVSTAQDDSVLLTWDAGTGTMIIGATGGVLANRESNWVFCDVQSLTTLDLDDLHTEYTAGMYGMFNSAILPSGFTLPDGFGSQVTNMNYMFQGAILPSGFTLPDGFGSQAINMAYMFQGATFQSDLDWTRAGFTPARLGSLDVSDMFNGTVFNGYKLRVADADVQSKFTTSTGDAGTTTNIIVAP